MIEFLDKNFGDVPVTNDPDGRKTFRDVLTGWTTDAEVKRALLQIGGDAETFEEGLDQVNDFDSFADEDDFGNYVQTRTRKGSLPLEGMLLPNGEPAERAFTSDRRPGSGVHNWLHGEFQEGRSSPIDVGNAQLNLGNIMFWRIHGWIENKWRQFEKVHKRTPAEQQVYDRHMATYRQHMIARGPVEHVPSAVSQDVRPVVLSNEVDCSRVTPHTVTDECKGRSDVQTTPRVNNGTVCIIDTQKLKRAEDVLVERKYLKAGLVNGHPINDGVWDRLSQDALNRWLQTNKMPPSECLTRALFEMLDALGSKTEAPETATEATEGKPARTTKAKTTRTPSLGSCTRKSFWRGTQRGTCINTRTSRCSGTLYSGLCPGAANIQCCIK